MDNTNTTSRGTPWANTWDAKWAQRVEAAESAEGTRVCGARTLTADPCTLQSDHPTGRCRYHGGTDTIGAPEGNQHARTHGLYARRLQRCGTHCPVWEHCPLADDDVLALEPKQRPVCAYEAEEYEQTLEHMETSTRPGASRHNLALLQVMLSRAAAALSVTALTDTVKSESENYQLHTTKQHPALQAFLRIARELRAAQTQHSRNHDQEANTQNEPASNLADRATPLLEKTGGILEEAVEAECQREEYTRRLEWIAHDHLGSNWRNHDPIREFALPRSKPRVGEPAHQPGFKTGHPPPNERPKFTPHTEPEQSAQPP